MPRLTNGQTDILKHNITDMMTIRGYTQVQDVRYDSNQIYMDYTHPAESIVDIRVILFLFSVDVLLPIDKILNALTKNWQNALMFVTAKPPTVGQIAKMPTGVEVRLYDDFKINPFIGAYSSASDKIVEFADIQSMHYANTDDIPRILYTDPVAVWLGAQPGNIIESRIPTKAVPYRLVYRMVI
jgi:DNA-directed RNA polymerase subunit H (RpoH/RPB5)